MAKRPKLVLIDGSAVFHRGYHAIPHLTNKAGEPTNAVYGFAVMLLKMLADLKPEYAIVAWDKSSKTFRNDMYSEYKATRTKQPDDLYAQIPTTKELIEALAIPFVELENYEADDIIGTLAKQAEEGAGVQTIIVTGDLDELQLIDDNTHVYAMRRGITDTVIYDAVALHERYGVTPKQFIDVKALKGDSSDNIPGVPGIGEKTAMDLIQRYATLEGVYDHLDDLKPGVRAKLEEHKDLAFLSRKLSTIVLDAPVSLDLRQARLGQYDKAAIHELFRRLEFRSLLSKLPPEMAAGGPPTLFDDAETKPARERKHLTSAKYQALTTTKELEQLATELARQPVFAIDTETDSINTQTANLVGISIAWKESEAYYIPVGHTEGTQLQSQPVIDRLKPILEDPKIGKIGHNLKFDYQILRRYGVKLGPVAMDTMIASFLVNPLGRAQSLDDLAYSELGVEMIPISELIGQGRNQTTFDTALIEQATIYAAEDADMAWRLYQRLQPQLEEQGFAKLAQATEWPLIPILGDMELAGVGLDVDFLKDYNIGISKTILELERKICELAGCQFNINSPAQLADVLYNRLGLTAPGIKRGKTGGISTAARELEKLRGQHPVVDLLFDYRELVKLKTTYVDALPKQVAHDGRVHTSFSQVIAQTGRLSSNNPNLQNIPVRTEEGRKIRQAFVAPPGRKLVAADYSQIELRVAAALSQDEAMIETFRQGIDLHQQTAAELYGVPLDQVSKDQRYNAKTINFGVLYGMSAHGLSVATGMTREEAAGFIQRYFEVRPKLAEYIAATKAFAREHEYTSTLLGRRRPCPEINSNNHIMAAAAERMAVNVPIQGTAADIYKLAMIALAPKLDADTPLLLQIHDELIVEAPETKAKALAQTMKETMEGVYDLGVPLAVDTAIGQNWGQI